MQALTDISHSALCCHSNKTCALIAYLTSSAQLEGTPTIPSSYVRVRVAVWECGERQIDRHTDGRNHYTFCLGCASRTI